MDSLLTPGGCWVDWLQEATMSWKISGRYFENCTCNVVCPCTASLALGADNDRCQVLLAFHIDSGEIEGVDVSGLTLAAVADTPKYMHEGNWRLGVLVDDAADDQQTEKLGAVFGGALGGPMAGLVPLVAEQLGVQKVPMQFGSADGHHTLTLGELGSLAVDDVVSFGNDGGAAVQMANIFHPANSTLTVGKSGDSRLEAFGLTPQLAGKAGFSAEFAWSA
jgi:hypothetical protein